MHNWQKAHTNEQFRRKLMIREAVIDGIRQFFKQRQFHEVETPLFVTHPDPEPTIEPFATSLELMDGTTVAGYLTTSPEFNMKKLLAAGFGSIFQICKAFRNGEPPSSRHNSEFTILEWYRVDADYRDIMQDCEELLRFLLQHVKTEHGEQRHSGTLLYQGREYNLAPAWERLSVLEAFAKYGQIDEQTFFDRNLFAATMQEKGYQVAGTDSLLDLQTQLLVQEIEPQLGRDTPTFLYDYPADQAALSRKKADDPRLAERFELYLAGLELGNAFSELADHDEQAARLRSQQQERRMSGKRSWEPDADFLAALKVGIPTTGGIAVGVDRLVMLFADTTDIQETLLFPQRELIE
jgi:lysyl-tRNA synthetase class 2